MSEMLDRAAAALVQADKTYSGVNFKQLPAFVRDEVRARARAVLSALRDPTKDVAEAARVEGFRYQGPRTTWNLMVDEILK